MNALKNRNLYLKSMRGGYLSKPVFKRLLNVTNRANNAMFVLGYNKGLNKIYGNDLLLRAVAEIRKLMPNIDL